VRKLLIATLPCLVLGLAGPAFAAHAGGHASGNADHGAAQHDGGVRTGTTTVGNTTGVGTVKADGMTFTGDAQGVSGATGGMGPSAEAQLSDRERVDRCSLDAILASNCQPRN
jgi:hypothetical protein